MGKAYSNENESIGSKFLNRCKEAGANFNGLFY